MRQATIEVARVACRRRDTPPARRTSRRPRTRPAARPLPRRAGAELWKPSARRQIPAAAVTRQDRPAQTGCSAATPYSDTTIGACTNPARTNRSRTCEDGASASDTCAKRSRMCASRRSDDLACGALGSTVRPPRAPPNRAGGCAIAEGRTAIEPAQHPRRRQTPPAPASTPVHRAHPASPGPSQRRQRAIEQLTAVADQPVVVQRQHDRDAAPRQRVDDRRRQARQVMDVRDIRADRVDDLARHAP